MLLPEFLLDALPEDSASCISEDAAVKLAEIADRIEILEED